MPVSAPMKPAQPMVANAWPLPSPSGWYTVTSGTCWNGPLVVQSSARNCTREPPRDGSTASPQAPPMLQAALMSSGKRAMRTSWRYDTPAPSAMPLASSRKRCSMKLDVSR